MDNPLETLKERANIQELAIAAAELSTVSEKEDEKAGYKAIADACNQLAEAMQHVVGSDTGNPQGNVGADAPAEPATPVVDTGAPVAPAEASAFVENPPKEGEGEPKE